MPRAQRAEFSIKGAKVDKNVRGACISALIPMKLGMHDLLAIAHICHIVIKVNFAQAACGNQH